MNLSGKAALITGGAKRIGRTTALELARRGCDIAVHYCTSKSDAEETARLIEAEGRKVVLLKADLSDPAAAARLPGLAADALGRLNILVNNASVFEEMSLASFSIENWQRTLAVNLTAPMVLSNAAFPLLRADKSGRIVNLSDIAAERPWPNHLAYCVSKAALSCLTVALAGAMAPDVHVNAVALGIALFPEHYDEAKRRELIRNVPAMRAGTMEEVAATIAFLVAGSDYITGAVLACDGGRSIAW